MKQHDIAGLQAYDLTTNLIMALNGAFFTTRRVGVQPAPYDIELAKRNVQTASYIFIKEINDLLNIYDSGHDTQATQASQKVINVATQLVRTTNQAITSGIGSKVSTYLGNKAHGAMGTLVGRLAQTLDTSVRDSAGRKWGDPARLVQTIVRDHFYQREVERRIQRLREEGERFFMVGDQGYSLNLFEELRSQLFHPNSTKLPEPFNVQTQP